MAELKTSITLSLVDKVSGNARKVTRQLEAVSKAAKGIMGTGAGRDSRGQFTKGSGLLGALNGTGKAAGVFGGQLAASARSAVGFGAKMAAAAGLAGYAFKSTFIDTAAEFERMETVLGTIEGSSAKARKALDWVTQFGATTPYEVGEVSEAFVRLRAYGLDPTNGLLRTLGDTASAMGKPLMSAVEAVADAMTGENERLKEFGIKAKVSGQKIVYEYSSNGKTMTRTAKRNSREQIEATLSAIWNEKYKGAMEAQSKTWTGMMSNLSDSWTQFKLTVMNAGLFDFLKTRMAALLERINAMARSGELQRWATTTGVRLMEIARKVEEVGKKVWAHRGEIVQAFKDVADGVLWAKDAMGGWGNLAKAIAIGSQAKLIASTVSLGVECGKLGIEIVKLLPKLAALKAAQAAAAGTGVAGAVGGAAAGGATFLGASALAAGVALTGAAAAGGAIGYGLEKKFSLGQNFAEAMIPDNTAGLGRTNRRGFRASTVRSGQVFAPSQATATPVGGKVVLEVRAADGSSVRIRSQRASRGTSLETAVHNGAQGSL